MKARLPQRSFVVVFACLVLLLLLYNWRSDFVDISMPPRGIPIEDSLPNALNSFSSVPVPVRKPKLVLLLSSYGRSGSSFVAEILQSEKSNLYFFEPVKMLRDQRIALTETNTISLLKDLWDCRIDPNFVSWLQTVKRPSQYVRHKTLSSCQSCIHLSDLERACRQETYVITKTIRLRLKYAKQLLTDPAMDIKVIHLVRDPRASDASMRHLKWNTNSSTFCPYAKEDFYLRRQFEKEFPHKYLFLRYEDLCRNPWRITANLFRFLSGATLYHNGPISEKSIRRDIPRNVEYFLRKHTNPRWSRKAMKDPYGTFRDTLNNWQKWRVSLTEEGLERTQESCSEIIHEAGYRMFSSLDELRNLSASSLVGVL